ncbi:MAG: cysteine protease, partial [Actinomyces sp.]|nr:cysteine protease [Actinomyces sp.]
MHSPLAYLFPQLPGDLGSIWSCQNELRNQSRDVRSLQNDISQLASTLTGWKGEAKTAFIRSENNELSELARWEEGTLQAADALKNYYFKLEEAKQKVDAIRGQADDLWDDFRSLSFRDMKARWEEYKKKLAELVILYSIAKGSLSNEALNTAASLREALYFTPEDHQQIDIDHDGDKDDVDLGDTRMMSQQELDDINERLQDPSKPLFDIDQGHIGDCHLLSTLNA